MQNRLIAFVFLVLSGLINPAISETTPTEPSKVFETLFGPSYGTIIINKVPACSGRDLIEMLSPEKKQILQQKAQAIVNGQGRFWKIDRPGKATSWLFGTTHVTDDDVNKLTSQEQKALEKADRVVLELAEIGTEGDNPLLAEVSADPTWFKVAEGNTIEDQLTDEEFAHFRSKLRKRGLNYRLISNMQPWIIWTTLSIPSCETLRIQTGLKPLDQRIALTAQSAGKPVIGLETIPEQLAALQNLPIAFHVHAILDSIADPTFNRDLFYTQTKLYLQGNIAEIMSLDEVFEGETTKRDMAVFKTILIDQRNARMAQRAAPLLEKGGSFIAVGAAHLPGKNGLIEKFRKMGYHVTRVNQKS